MRWMNLEPIIQSEASQKNQNKTKQILYTNTFLWNVEIMNLFAEQQ